MTALTFTLIEEPPGRLDLSPLTPQALAGMQRSDIEKIQIGTSRMPLALGEVFRISGNHVQTIFLEGGSSRFDRVGAGLTEGAIRVAGDVGAQAGRGMRGGRLTVEGNAGPHAGSGMRGGRLEILGDADDHLGAPLAGELAGMNGGVLVVRGKCRRIRRRPHAARPHRGPRRCRQQRRLPDDRRHAGGDRRTSAPCRAI